MAGAHATMPNSLVVPVVGYGHGQLSQDPYGCLAQEATRFLQFGVPSTLSEWPCAQNPPLPRFEIF